MDQYLINPGTLARHRHLVTPSMLLILVVFASVSTPFIKGDSRIDQPSIEEISLKIENATVMEIEKEFNGSVYQNTTGRSFDVYIVEIPANSDLWLALEGLKASGG